MSDVREFFDDRGGANVDNEAAYRDAIRRAEEAANPPPPVEKEWRYVRNPSGRIAAVVNKKTGERRHWMPPSQVDG